MPRWWTAAEDQLLLERYTAGESREAIAKQLGRTSDAVDARRRFLHRPARTIPTRRWSEAEETFLRAAAAAAVPSSAIASRLNRTPYAVRRRRETIGATSPRARPYTAEEDALIAATISVANPWETSQTSSGEATMHSDSMPDSSGYCASSNAAAGQLQTTNGSATRIRLGVQLHRPRSGYCRTAAKARSSHALTCSGSPNTGAAGTTATTLHLRAWSVSGCRRHTLRANSGEPKKRSPSAVAY
jgi:hypothetical protein